jgi:hypothetical protein
MNMKQKKHLAVAVSVATTIGLAATTVQAVDFAVTATVENTLAVTVVNDFDLGTLFATTAGGVSDGVGALTITPAGVTSSAATQSATIKLISLGTPVPAQGSVAMADSFTLTFPDTSTIVEADFDDSNSGALATAQSAVGTELIIAGSDPSVASLWMSHFVVGDVSGGTVGTETDAAGSTLVNGGTFPIAQSFGATDYIFNIGATVATEADTGLAYQPGLYSGTFTVTASY